MSNSLRKKKLSFSLPSMKPTERKVFQLKNSLRGFTVSVDLDAQRPNQCGGGQAQGLSGAIDAFAYAYA